MNKKVLRVMIALVAVFLVSLYVIKIFFPEQFIMTIENEQLIKIGNYIDTHNWLTALVAGCASFITYALFVCAVTNKWRLSLKEFICIVLVIVVTQVLYFYNVDMANLISILGMLLIPLMSKPKYSHFAIVYCVHYTAQLLSLKIRSLPLLLTNTNSLIAMCLTAESYLWLLLFYFLLNYKKEV